MRCTRTASWPSIGNDRRAGLVLPVRAGRDPRSRRSVRERAHRPPRAASSLFKMGKHGILWELDRLTGAFVAAHDLGYQNVHRRRPRDRRRDLPARDGPGGRASRSTSAPTCSAVSATGARAPTTRRRGALYIPIHPTCVRGMFTELEQVEGNDYYADRGWFSRGSRVHPDSGEHAGHLIAMDIDTGEILWRHSMATRPGAAALTTAGGLVVSADTDRNLSIHDVETGDVLFHTRLPGSVQGFPITYAVGGRQYLAAPLGGGRSNAIYVFALPDQVHHHLPTHQRPAPPVLRDVTEHPVLDLVPLARPRRKVAHRETRNACRTDPRTEQSVLQCRSSRRGLRGGASGCQHCTCGHTGALVSVPESEHAENFPG